MKAAPEAVGAGSGSPCRLIVHADDLGQAEPINAGVLQAHREGIVTSASIMPVGRAFEQAVVACRQRPSLDVGVHLTLVEERPLLPPERVTTLVGGDGRFHHGHSTFVRRYLAGAIDAEQVRNELDAQIGKALERGLPVTHLDSHQHLHMLPRIRRIVSDLARKYGISSVRRSREPISLYMFRDLRNVGRLLQLLTLNLVALAGRSAHWTTTDRFAGFFFGGRLDLANLERVLTRLPHSGTCELMCHPGAANPAASASDRYDRVAELAALTSPRAAELVLGQGIELISFRDLVPPERNARGAAKPQF